MLVCVKVALVSFESTHRLVKGKMYFQWYKIVLLQLAFVVNNTPGKCLGIHHEYNLHIVCEQAQQLFQRDAQTITPEALESVKAALANSEIEHKAETKKKAVPRKAAGQNWEDPTLAEWPESMILSFISSTRFFNP